MTVATLTVNLNVDEFVAALFDPRAIKERFTVPVAFGVPLTVNESVLLPVPEVDVETVAQAGAPLTDHVYISKGSVEVALNVDVAL